jgi:hypothetical protein
VRLSRFYHKSKKYLRNWDPAERDSDKYRQLSFDPDKAGIILI